MITGTFLDDIPSEMVQNWYRLRSTESMCTSSAANQLNNHYTFGHIVPVRGSKVSLVVTKFKL